LLALGVDIQTNVVIDKTLTIEDLYEMGYQCIFVGSGAGLPKFMGIKGENYNGVYSANEFLTRINLMKAYLPNSNTPIPLPKKAVIVGGGNVAMDAARCAVRIGANVTVVYRRSEAELPARVEEVQHAKEEGVHFCMLTNPTEILADEKGNVSGVVCVEMMLGEPDASGRRRPMIKPDSEHIIEADTVIMSLGTSPNPFIKSLAKGLELRPYGGIVINEETGMTTVDGVFAGGDAVTGAATVILAMGAGKLAAKGIDQYLKSKE
jgi:glutamate synthase (NADPH/NADH) small chain